MKKNLPIVNLKESSHLRNWRSNMGANLRLKNLVSCAVVFLAAAAPCFPQGQGWVSFRNYDPYNTPDPTGGNRLVYDVGSPLDPVNGARLVGTNWVAEIYVGTDAVSLTPLTES